MVVPNNSRKEQVFKLIEEKDKMERKINELGQVLTANKNIGMSESLVDADGYPRNDIDVHQVRHSRHQIICLQNDLKALMKEIEKGLHDVHAEEAASGSGNASTKMSQMKIDENVNESKPFVKVNLVSPGSPAEDAGIRLGDAIIQFGSITAENFKDLMQIGEVVKHRQNSNVSVKVLRNGRLNEMTLIPRAWSGRGLLGCNVVLYDTIER